MTVRQTDRQTDGQTDRRTDGVNYSNKSMLLSLVCDCRYFGVIWCYLKVELFRNPSNDPSLKKFVVLFSGIRF